MPENALSAVQATTNQTSTHAADATIIAQAKHLPETLIRSVEQSPLEPAQWHRQHGHYLSITYAELLTRIRHVATGLLKAGIKPGERIAILMENRPEWAVADFAILSIGAVTVPLYCSYRPQDIGYVLNDCGAVAAITSEGKLLRELLTAQCEARHLKQIYALDLDQPRQIARPFSELESLEPDLAQLQKRLDKIDRDTLATLVYTSGTTANPKGVMLTHGNILANLEAVPDFIDIQMLKAGNCMLSFLPLAHVLERTGSHFFPYAYGLSVAFAERPDTVAKNMLEAKPSYMIAVPRMLEVIRSRILSQVAKQPAIKQHLFHRYMRLAGSSTLGLIGQLQYRLLDRLVASKIRARFGGRLLALISGGAPLNREVATFFESLGLPVIEGYGLSESAPLLTANPMHDRRPGSVGVAVRGVELRIAEDGEILARGANIMAGYWKNRTATKETLRDGWLHTGDIGEIDADGYLRITDRKKDIIVNSGGENIAPQRIETILISDEKIDQVVLYGDQKPYLVALVVPNEAACRAWAEAQGLPPCDWPQLCQSEQLKKRIQTRINQILKPLNPFEQVRRIHLLDHPFSIESGLMTATMKIKRRKVYDAYQTILESLYLP